MQHIVLVVNIKIKILAQYLILHVSHFKQLNILQVGMAGWYVVKKSDEILIKKLRWFGFDDLKKDWKGARLDKVNILGYKYQLNNFSAALGLSNLKDINL